MAELPRDIPGENLKRWLARTPEQAIDPEQPIIVVKVGGCGMVTYGFGFEKQKDPPDSQTLARAWQPYFAHLVECFGSSRCMFESNFPVDKLSCSYGNLWNAFKRIANGLGLSVEERADLFHRTAARSYSMNATAGSVA